MKSNEIKSSQNTPKFEIKYHLLLRPGLQAALTGSRSDLIRLSHMTKIIMEYTNLGYYTGILRSGLMSVLVHSHEQNTKTINLKKLKR